MTPEQNFWTRIENGRTVRYNKDYFYSNFKRKKPTKEELLMDEIEAELNDTWRQNIMGQIQEELNRAVRQVEQINQTVWIYDSPNYLVIR